MMQNYVLFGDVPLQLESSIESNLALLFDFAYFEIE
jgi:hypothetical protein